MATTTAKATPAKKKGRPTKAKPAEAKLVSTGPSVVTVDPTEPVSVRSEQSGRYTRFPALNRARDYLARLPQYTDDLSAELGTDVLERMYNDPAISASCESMILQVLSRGLRPKPRYTDREHEFYKQGIEAYDFISYAMDYQHDELMQYLEVGLTQTLEDMIRARLKFGNCAAEVTYRVSNSGGKHLSNKLLPSFINVLSPESFAVVSDPFKRIPGLAVFTGKSAGKGSQTVGQTLVPNWTSISNTEIPVDQLPDGWEVVPIAKFLYTYHRAKNGDKRGVSVLRPAFNPWVLTVQLYPEYLKFLRQFASPSIVGILSENARRKKVDGVWVDPSDALFDALLDFANGSVVTAPYGTEIEMMFSQSDGTAFVQALELLDRAKVKALTHSVLTESLNHQTRAASSTGKDIQDTPVQALKNDMCSMTERQFFKRLMYFNYGPDPAQLFTPRATLGTLAAEDRNATITALGSVGMMLTPSQHIWAANELEIDAPTPDEMATLQEKMKTEAAPPPAPVAAPGGAKKPAAKPAAKPKPKGK